MTRPDLTYLRKAMLACLLIFLISHHQPVAGNWLSDPIHITGFSILPELVRKKTYYDTEGRMYALENTELIIRLFGKFTPDSYLKFTKTMTDCNRAGKEEVKVSIRKCNVMFKKVAQLKYT